MRPLLFSVIFFVLSGCEGLVSALGSEKDNPNPNPIPAETCQLSRAPLTRLNIQDIDATLTSLVDDELKPARFFPADVIGALHFDNDATQLSIAPGLVQGLEASALRVIDAAWARDTTRTAISPSQNRLKSCAPGGAVTEASCASEILSRFARRAWRRPVTRDELTSLVQLYDATRAAGDDFESATKLALSAVLVSPNFLLRTEAVVPEAQAASTWAVASRLSYFVWGTSPDDELAALADSGAIAQKSVLDAQVARLLADPRAATLKRRFVAQWFNVGNVEGVALDAASFPGVTTGVMKAMQLQIGAYLDEFLFSDRDALDLIDAPVTYVNGTLAGFLKLSASGDALTRVTLSPNDPRAGLLGQSAPLVVTSKTTKTNVPKRGNYVLERMLCAPLAPPPGVVVPPVPDATTDQPTVRQRLDALTASAACNGCHQVLDPIGYALEVYGADSRLRTQENGATIDPSGIFAGKSFQNAQGLVQLIKADPRTESCMVDRTLTYALGRRLAVDGADQAMVRTLQSSFSSKHRRFQALLAEVAGAAAIACKP